MLRRKPDNSAQLIRHVRLYLDHVERLHHELEEACESVSIEMKGYKADALADLDEHPKNRIVDLRLAGHAPSVSVNFIGVGALVHRHDDDNEALGLAERLRQILLPCRRRPRWLFTWPAALIAGIAPSVVLGLLKALDVIEGASLWVLIPLNAVGLAAFGFLAYLAVRRGSVVYPVRRRDAPSFLRRNADALSVNGLIAVVSILGTFALTYYFLKE